MFYAEDPRPHLSPGDAVAYEIINDAAAEILIRHTNPEEVPAYNILCAWLDEYETVVRGVPAMVRPT